jgi:hypothetical protein
VVYILGFPTLAVLNVCQRSGIDAQCLLLFRDDAGTFLNIDAAALDLLEPVLALTGASQVFLNFFVSNLNLKIRFN